MQNSLQRKLRNFCQKEINVERYEKNILIKSLFLIKSVSVYNYQLSDSKYKLPFLPLLAIKLSNVSHV